MSIKKSTKYIPTIADMLCNAMNNFDGRKLVVYPQSTIDAQPSLKTIFGDRLVALESISVADQRAAMDAYKLNTDWSAFSHSQFTAAYATLEG